MFACMGIAISLEAPGKETEIISLDSVSSYLNMR